MKPFFSALFLALTLVARAAEVIPPAPKAYFNDYAGVVAPETNARLNKTLEDFERETSNQILVAVFAKMQSDSSIEDYTFRVKESWKVGQRAKNNGAVLFVFSQDRKMFLQVGYGLEGALPDALCKRIIEDEIKPHFKSGDFSAGLNAGVTAILAAAKGEYQGTGRTVSDGRNSLGVDRGSLVAIFFTLLILIILISAVRQTARRGWVFTSGGYSGGGGGWSGGGGGSSGSSGGFSGGGGSGGGGASGSW